MPPNTPLHTRRPGSILFLYTQNIAVSMYLVTKKMYTLRTQWLLKAESLTHSLKRMVKNQGCSAEKKLCSTQWVKDL